MASLKIAALQRNVLIALARFLMQDRPGGVMGPAIEMLVKVLRGRGAIAYTCDESNKKLEMASESGLPRRAKAWLAHLRLNEEPWFIAQVVAVSQRVEIDETLAASRQGVSIRPALEEAGWQALAATPVRVGRRLYGVIVVASDNPYSFDKDTLMLLESVGGIVGLALERDRAVGAATEASLPDRRTAGLITQGLIAGSVARDLQDPLASLGGLTETQEHALNHLRRQGVAPDLVEHLDLALQDTREALRRVESVSARLLVLSQESERVELNLTQLVHAAAESVSDDLDRRGITFEVYTGSEEDEALFIEGRVDALQMTFVQLLVYAADKCIAGASAAEPVMALRMTTTGDRHEVVIESSAGRDDDDLPFSTLIRRGGDQNLGLELARETVKNHNGHVELGRSTLGGGAITVVLPAAAAETAVFSRSESLPAMPAFQDAPRSIVWIDDDATFVRVMCRQFESHEARVAGSLAEARALFDELEFLPELILCDVNLPDGLGIRLHAEAPAELADRFVFMTGGVIAEEVARYLKRSQRPTLIKPVRVDEVNRLLADEGGPNVASTLRRDGAAHASNGVADDDDDDAYEFDGYPDEVGPALGRGPTAMAAPVVSSAPPPAKRAAVDFRGTMPGYQGVPSDPPPPPTDDPDLRLDLELDLEEDEEPPSRGLAPSPVPPPDLGSVAPPDIEGVDEGWDL
ncbi:MAG: GAF domain-containing protein [Myxococcota bacterium]